MSRASRPRARAAARVPRARLGRGVSGSSGEGDTRGPDPPFGAQRPAPRATREAPRSPEPRPGEPAPARGAEAWRQGAPPRQVGRWRRSHAGQGFSRAQKRCPFPEPRLRTPQARSPGGGNLDPGPSLRPPLRFSGFARASQPGRNLSTSMRTKPRLSFLEVESLLRGTQARPPRVDGATGRTRWPGPAARSTRTRGRASPRRASCLGPLWITVRIKRSLVALSFPPSRHSAHPAPL